VRVTPYKPVRVQALPLIPSQNRYIAGKSFLIGQPLTLVLAEKNHRATPRERFLVFCRLIRPVLDDLVADASFPQCVLDGSAQAWNELLAVPSNLVVDQNVRRVGLLRLGPPLVGVDADWPDCASLFPKVRLVHVVGPLRVLEIAHDRVLLAEVWPLAGVRHQTNTGHDGVVTSIPLQGMPASPQHAHRIVGSQLVERQIDFVITAQAVEAPAKVDEHLVQTARTRLAANEAANKGANVTVARNPSVALRGLLVIKTQTAHATFVFRVKGAPYEAGTYATFAWCTGRSFKRPTRSAPSKSKA